MSEDRRADGGVPGRALAASRGATGADGDPRQVPPRTPVWDREFRRHGMFWGLIWLAYLVYPLAGLVGPHLAAVQRLLGAAGLALFVGLYIWTLGGVAGGDARRAPRGAALTLALAVFLTRAVGPNWSGLFVFASTMFAWSLPRWAAAAGVLASTAACAATLAWIRVDAGTLASLAVTCLLVGGGVMGLSQLLRATRALREAQDEIARLAAVDERLRIARDVHDLLGHSLSVIALKADLAGRLLGADAGRAAAEIADIQAVARRALAEVREAVAGYRRPRLEEELARARAALEAAGIRCACAPTRAEVPEALGALLGWAVREGTTNVLRHSRAAHCRIGIERRAGWLELVVEDDGQGAPEAAAPAGLGLAGLRERLAAAGGVLEAGPLPGGGFRLAARVPAGGLGNS